jgi:hypothetical protein
MIVFTKKYHEAIKEGKITLTFRAWDTLKVLRGKIYRAYNLGLIKVLDVDFKKLENITIEEVKSCGYKNMEEFRDDFQKIAKRDIDFDRERAVRIEFEYIGEDIENYKKAMGDVKDSELFDIKEKLLKLEQKGKKQWAVRALELLRKKDYMSFTEMERALKTPSEKVRQRMKKLKTLNLTSSDSKMGYSITPLGVKLLKSMNK